MLEFLWWRWLALGWIGRILAVAIVIYAAGWALGNLGLNENGA